MDLELACHRKGVSIVEKLCKMSVIVVGHTDVLDKAILAPVTPNLTLKLRKALSDLIPEPYGPCAFFICSKAFQVSRRSRKFDSAASMLVLRPGQCGKTRSMASEKTTH